jgi:hypothetical protein
VDGQGAQRTTPTLQMDDEISQTTIRSPHSNRSARLPPTAIRTRSGHCLPLRDIRPSNQNRVCQDPPAGAIMPGLPKSGRSSESRAYGTNSIATPALTPKVFLQGGCLGCGKSRGQAQRSSVADVLCRLGQGWVEGNKFSRIRTLPRAMA